MTHITGRASTRSPGASGVLPPRGIGRKRLSREAARSPGIGRPSRGASLVAPIAGTRHRRGAKSAARPGTPLHRQRAATEPLNTSPSSSHPTPPSLAVASSGPLAPSTTAPNAGSPGILDAARVQPSPGIAVGSGVLGHPAALPRSRTRSRHRRRSRPRDRFVLHPRPGAMRDATEVSAPQLRILPSLRSRNLQASLRVRFNIASEGNCFVALLGSTGAPPRIAASATVAVARVGDLSTRPAGRQSRPAPGLPHARHPCATPRFMRAHNSYTRAHN